MQEIKLVSLKNFNDDETQLLGEIMETVPDIVGMHRNT